MKVPEKMRHAEPPSLVRQGYGFAGAVKVDEEWNAFIYENTSLQRKPFVGSLSIHSTKPKRPCPLWVVFTYGKGRNARPTHVSVRLLVPDLKWSPQEPTDEETTWREMPGFMPVNEFIPYQEGWEPEGKQCPT